MSKIIGFAKRESIFVISAICAIITILIVPPSRAYLSYIDLRVLIILFCLMAAVAGFQRVGVFDALSKKLLSSRGGGKRISLLLVMTCFFTAMFITNDVALITFVPLTIYLMDRSRPDSFIFLIVMETVAANLGSLVTPVGNPQNLFIYQHYNLQIWEFLKITLPLGALCLVFVTVIMLLSKCAHEKDVSKMTFRGLNKSGAIKFGILFLVCILTVLRVLNIYICFGVTVLILLFTDRKVFGMVDYCLLLTFVNFFILVGNLSSIEWINSFVDSVLMGREALVSALTSQVISNVPAAVMLGHFTDNFEGLILGTNIGGLGTPIASLASIISFKYYSLLKDAAKGRYLFIFLAVNFSLLAILLLIFCRI